MGWDSWSNGRIIALFVLAFLLLIAFAIVQVSLPEQAILPPRVFLQRSIASGFWTSLCTGAHQTIFLYYLPIWFQAIQNKSAVNSGIDLLPMVLVIAAVSIANGQLVSLIGYYTPSLILGVCLAAIGSGMLTTLGIHTSEGKWIGYQILYGAGLGFASQAPNMAAQTVLPEQDVAIGASLMFLGQTLFGAVFVSVGENVFNDQLTKRLAKIPGIGIMPDQSTGATDFLDGVDIEYRTAALEAYNVSLRVVFQVALCMACLGAPGALVMEWRTVKKPPPKGHGSKQAAEKDRGQGVLNEKGASEANAGDEEGMAVTSADK
ncbi:hypothetical protein VMCG_02062 [Cytospora schulzeri]|uniref:Major facilitator superfamily (MFS) profile domain-containing protein n=1 Tax=Cytospora schulzeri TaxID=448051 RepID=A0A423X3J7_9PEZI|nr:hypothetical protein VMCG_02062 [Valsa malicola]